MKMDNFLKASCYGITFKPVRNPDDMFGVPHIEVTLRIRAKPGIIAQLHAVDQDKDIVIMIEKKK